MLISFQKHRILLLLPATVQCLIAGNKIDNYYQNIYIKYCL